MRTPLIGATRGATRNDHATATSLALPLSAQRDYVLRTRFCFLRTLVIIESGYCDEIAIRAAGT